MRDRSTILISALGVLCYSSAKHGADIRGWSDAGAPRSNVHQIRAAASSPRIPCQHKTEPRSGHPSPNLLVNCPDRPPLRWWRADISDASLRSQIRLTSSARWSLHPCLYRLYMPFHCPISTSSSTDHIFQLADIHEHSSGAGLRRFLIKVNAHQLSCQAVVIGMGARVKRQQLALQSALGRYCAVIALRYIIPVDWLIYREEHCVQLLVSLR